MGFRAHLRFSACKVGHQPAEHGCNLDLYGWSAPLCKGTGQCAIGHFLVSREMSHHTECTPIEAEMWYFKGLIRKLSNVFRGPPRGKSWHVPPRAFRSELSKSELVTLARSQSTVMDQTRSYCDWLASLAVFKTKWAQKNETFSGVYFGCLFTATKSASITLRTP